jgi:ATP-dependent Lon protease
VLDIALEPCVEASAKEADTPETDLDGTA